jgi:hypothetical protein
MKHKTVSEKIKDNGLYNDLHEYQELKVSKDKEVEATAKYKEHLRRKFGFAAAEAIMKRKGYDPELVK